MSFVQVNIPHTKDINSWLKNMTLQYFLATSIALLACEICSKYLFTQHNKEHETRMPNQNNLFLVTFHTVLGLCLKHLVDPF